MEIETTYILMATWNGNHWMRLGKELKSKKLVLSGLKKTKYPPNYSKFLELKWVKNVKTIVSTDEEFIEFE